MNFGHDFDSRRMSCVPSVGVGLPTFASGVVPEDVKRGLGCVPKAAGSAPTVC
jgi:hypothetical protein